jgi:hypothetical protein
MSDEASELDSTNDEEIVEQMEEARDKLGEGIDRLSEDMRQVFDWQAYVRSAPLTSVGIAAALGYLLAPAIRSAPAAAPVQYGPAKSSEGGIVNTLVSLAFGTAMRFGTGYLTEWLMPQANSLHNEKPAASAGRPDDQPPDLGY